MEYHEHSQIYDRGSQCRQGTDEGAECDSAEDGVRGVFVGVELPEWDDKEEGEVEV